MRLVDVRLINHTPHEQQRSILFLVQTVILQKKERARGKTDGRAPINCWLESMGRVSKRKYDIKNTRKTQHKNIFSGMALCLSMCIRKDTFW
jgi:hypothetical protein